MRTGKLVAEVFFIPPRHATAYSTGAIVYGSTERANVWEGQTQEEAIEFCYRTFGEDVIFVQNSGHSMLVIQEKY